MGGRHLRLNLENITWPLNVLKFNQAIAQMDPGDELITVIKDANVANNLELIISGQTELRCQVFHLGAEYRIAVNRKATEGTES